MKWENDTFLETFDTSGKAERLNKAEGFPKNLSIEELTFPTAVELNLQHKSIEL